MAIFSALIKLTKSRTIAITFILAMSTQTQAASPGPVVALDLPIAETLIELGASPVVISQRSSFDFWTGGTYKSANVVEAGAPAPNVELLQEIEPDWIFLPPWKSNLKLRLSSVAPVKVVDSYPYVGEGDVWQRLLAFTHQIGQIIGKQQEAAQLIQNTQTHLDNLKEQINDNSMPFLFIQLWGERHVRIFGKNSLLQTVAQQLELQNAWHGETNQWGYSLVGIEALLNIEARLVVIKSPSPISTEERLAQNAIWRHLPSVQRGDVIVLPSTFWIAGGLPSARRFADAITRALEDNDP